MYRVPNAEGSVVDKERDDLDLLVAEMAYSSAWRTMLETNLGPRVLEIRRQLLTDTSLDELSRRVLMGKLEEYKTFLEGVYATTEAGELPNNVAVLFQ